ncbi:MAG: OadG family protein [Clostridia bacterium]|nr:OadG family protein [Clostridia bacterium]
MQPFILALSAANDDPSILFTCLLGVGVVFVGLVCIVGIVMLMNKLTSGKDQESPTPSAPAVAPVAKAVSAPIENRQEIIAAVVAAVAEENGTDISAIRVLSFKKL